MALREILRKRPLLKRLQSQGVEEGQGSYLEIGENYIDIYRSAGSTYPSKRIDYYSDVGCTITERARAITTAMAMRHGILQMDAAGGTYLVRKTPEGGAVVESV